jgi:hypothetical protein
VSLLHFFRNLETLPALKTTLLLGLGGALAFSSGALLWHSPKAAFSLDYIRGHGHYAQPWMGFATGVVLVAYGIKRLCK